LIGPEALIAVQPLHRRHHRVRPQRACDNAPAFAAHDQSGIAEHIEMLHHRWQRHREWPRDFADRQIALIGQPGDNGAARRIGQRGECVIERGGVILNH